MGPWCRGRIGRLPIEVSLLQLWTCPEPGGRARENSWPPRVMLYRKAVFCGNKMPDRQPTRLTADLIARELEWMAERGVRRRFPIVPSLLVSVQPGDWKSEAAVQSSTADVAFKNTGNWTIRALPEPIFFSRVCVNASSQATNGLSALADVLTRAVARTWNAGCCASTAISPGSVSVKCEHAPSRR